MKVLVTGATGLIGKEIGKILSADGHSLVIITRNAERAKLELPFTAEIIVGNLVENPIADVRLSNVDAVIHLAGENVGAGRWSKKKKIDILLSRQIATKNLMLSLRENKALKVFVAASAVGYYGDGKDKLLTESSARGTDFLAEVCEKWETQVAMNPIADRSVIFRLGVVLSPNGGALSKMLTPFRMGFGGALGNGRQWISWIHITDIANLFKTALTDKKFNGVYNAVAPEPVTNMDLSRTLAKTVNSRLFLPVPAVLLRIILGEQATILLNSQKVSAEKLLATGFNFRFPKLNEAVENCCSQSPTK